MRIKSENSDVDLGHDRSQKRGGLECAETLSPQGLSEFVNFKQRFAKRVVLARTAGPDRVIAFPQGRKQIRDRLPRPDDMFAHARDITTREPRDHEREGPLQFGAVVAEPEQAKCDQRRRDHCANR